MYGYWPNEDEKKHSVTWSGGALGQEVGRTHKVLNSRLTGNIYRESIGVKIAANGNLPGYSGIDALRATAFGVGATSPISARQFDSY